MHSEYSSIKPRFKKDDYVLVNGGDNPDVRMRHLNGKVGQIVDEYIYRGHEFFYKVNFFDEDIQPSWLYEECLETLLDKDELISFPMELWGELQKKKSLKKWEVELGISHEGLALPWDQPEESKAPNNLEVDKVIFNGNRTIILWNDGTKTMSNPTAGDDFDKYTGFCIAFVKKIFGSSNQAKKFLDSVAYDQTPESDERKKYIDIVGDLMKYTSSPKAINLGTVVVNENEKIVCKKGDIYERD